MVELATYAALGALGAAATYGANPDTYGAVAVLLVALVGIGAAMALAIRAGRADRGAAYRRARAAGPSRGLTCL